MKTITFTDFRKRASGFITEVEHGETLILLRRGKPVAEIIKRIKGVERVKELVKNDKHVHR